jgi:hypothetical protein
MDMQSKVEMPKKDNDKVLPGIEPGLPEDTDLNQNPE